MGLTAAQYFRIGKLPPYSEYNIKTTTPFHAMVRTEWPSAILAFRLGVKPSKIYQTEKQTYSNIQLPKRGFDATE